MVSDTHVAADKRLVDEAEVDALRRELKALEAAAALLSAERRHLHQQIDFGYSASETLRAREREVSDERRELHRRIDSLRELLGVDGKNTDVPTETVWKVRELDPDQAPERLL